jgi:hypothetical protein
MKKYLLGLFAIAIAIGFSAFTAKSSHRQAKNENQLYYFDWVQNSPSITYDGFEFVADVESQTGCDNATSTLCARGYTLGQLANQSDPSQGPANINTYTTQVNKSIGQ